MTARTLVYLAGPPGAGKSTTMTALTGGCQRSARTTPFAHDMLIDPLSGLPVAAEMGRRREAFSGTDALSMSVAPKAREWVTSRAAPPLLLGEGDRLAVMSFLEAARDGGYAVQLVYLSAPGYVLDRRCAQRGSKQNPSWRAGRATKAQRLFETACGRVEPGGFTGAHFMDTEGRPPETVAAVIRSTIPALAALPHPKGN